MVSCLAQSVEATPHHEEWLSRQEKNAPVSADASHLAKLDTHLNGVSMSASPSFSRAPLTVGGVQLRPGQREVNVSFAAQKGGSCWEPTRAEARLTRSRRGLGSCAGE